MTVEISQSELRNDNAVIMRRVAAGESFVVTVNGRPIAVIVPHQGDRGRRRFVPAAAAIAALTATPISHEDAEQWWRDIRENADGPGDPWEPQPGRR